jgi:cadmium resistance protein CadD (predicted permease)
MISLSRIQQLFEVFEKWIRWNCSLVFFLNGLFISSERQNLEYIYPLPPFEL